jgi:dienelactone hydrolase
MQTIMKIIQSKLNQTALRTKVARLLPRCLPAFFVSVSLTLMLTVVLPISASLGDEPSAIDQLKKHLRGSSDGIASVVDQEFASQPLSKSQAKQAQKLIVNAWKESIHDERAAELKSGKLKVGKYEMPIFVKKFGKQPKDGWSLYISMHGGGGAPKRLNDRQWQNQKRLYQPQEGIYVAPRAPTDSWNLWHQGHIDQLYDRLITSLIVTEGVNPNRVYIMGYSAGGDGVYQLAPRMADRLAAAAMMAGHPNETSPLGLRNLPFTIHMGGKDAAYKRNTIAANWKTKLAELNKQDPGGYVHHVEIHEGMGHWMERQDAVALPWMAKHSRKRFPDRIVWKQDDVQHSRFYWLSVNTPAKPDRAEVVAERDKQSIAIEKSDVDALTVLLNDEMLDMDNPVDFKWGTANVGNQVVPRNIKNLVVSLLERGDPAMMFSGRVEISKPESK